MLSCIEHGVVSYTLACIWSDVLVHFTAYTVLLHSLTSINGSDEHNVIYCEVKI